MVAIPMAVRKLNAHSVVHQLFYIQQIVGATGTVENLYELLRNKANIQIINILLVQHVIFASIFIL